MRRTAIFLSEGLLLDFDRKTVLPAMFPAELTDARVIGREWAIQINRPGNQQPVGGIAVLQMTECMAARSSMVSERNRLDAGPVEEPLHPRVDG